MNDDAAATAEQGKAVGFWSFKTTDESVAAGQVNFWAMAETVAAICAFWWVALRWETLFLLYSSLFLAPLLLLRSDASVAWAVEKYATGLFPIHQNASIKEKERRNSILAWLAGASALFASFAASVLISRLFISGHEGFSGFFRGAIFGLISINIAVAVATVVVAAGKGVSEGADAEGTAAFSAAFLTVAGVWMEAGAAAALGAAALVTVTLIFASIIQNLITTIIIYISIGQSIIIGIWLFTIIIRIISNFVNFFYCYKHISLNSYNIIFRISTFHTPEVIPGLPENHVLKINTISNLALSHLNSNSLDNIFVGIILYFFIFFWLFIGWAYRFILKSTMWLWWILLFIGGALTIPGRIKGLKARVYRKWYSWIFIALSVATLAGFAFGHALVPIVKDRLSDAPLLPGIAYLFLIDWASITIFQWFLLVSSGMTIFALFWANALAVDDGVEELGPKVDRGLTRIKLFLDAKTFFGLITILMTMAYVLLLWNKTSGRFSVSPWAFGYLDWIYGNYAGALIR